MNSLNNDILSPETDNPESSETTNNFVIKTKLLSKKVTEEPGRLDIFNQKRKS